MNFRQALQWGTHQLRDKKISTASLDAEVLFCFVLKKPKEYLALSPEHTLGTRQLATFQKLITRRKKREPVAYLTGHKEFYGLDFYLDRNVLIPRPESELIVDEVLHSCDKQQVPSGTFTIADIGTGSGCIAVTLAKLLPNTKIIASDVSKKALTVARRNARKQKVGVRFIQGDLLTPLATVPLDVIVANLPYGRTTERPSRPTQSIWYEPKSAFVAGPTGLEVITKFLHQMAQRPQKPKLIMLEFGWKQKKSLLRLVKKFTPEYAAAVKKDLAGCDRLLCLNR